MTRDTIYTKPLNDISGFAFDENVVKVFSDMIERSVPGYQTIISAIGLLADKFAQPDSICYDLGCSLGAATLSMRHHLQHRDNSTIDKIIAVDNSPAMIKDCQKILSGEESNVKVDLICGDIRDIDVTNASVVVLNFTLQFIPLEDRELFLKNIFAGMLPGGILILSEKLDYEDPDQNELHIKMHEMFKKNNGYSELEISQKRSALENVLIPEALEAHKQRLNNVGFKSAEVWFQYFNFASLIALKE
ncbi:MAG: carboxy-S-adenosyl-L-methionine synthase CmoA [Gammaproteobacteria bacterium]